MKPKIILKEREQFIQALQAKDWDVIVGIMQSDSNCKFIAADSVLFNIVEKHMIHELLTDKTSQENPSYKLHLFEFITLHNHKNYHFKLSAEDYKKVVLKLVEVEENAKTAYDYALKFPEEEVCKEVITTYETKIPKVVEHSQSEKLHVTTNRSVGVLDASTSLFKSIQEYHFYKAIREVFPTFLVFPNVALSAVIDFNLIKDSLSKEEKSYFFKALIDCVVFDSENRFKAVKFFELDSPYHDTEKQGIKDAYKDSILAKAGQKLWRIRRLSIELDETDFIKLIRETIK